MSEGRSGFRKLDTVASTVLKFGLFCIWPVVIAVALGATLFAVTHTELLPAMFDNELARGARFVGLGYFAASLVAVAAFYLFILRVRDREHWPPGFDRARRLNPYLSFLLSGPAIIALTEPRIETSHQWRTWLYIALAVLAWWPTFRALSGRDRSESRIEPIRSSRQREIISLGLVLILWAAYAYFFAKLAITNHHAFNTRTVDLGLYDNIFFQSSHGRPLACTFLRGGTHASAHFDPILVILSPLYRLWPRAEFLLTLQSIWCGAGVVAAYLMGRHQLGSRAWGLILALTYALHPALHGANLYEFHSLTLLVAPLLFALHFLFSGKFRLYFATLFLLLLIREDVSLVMCFVGLYGVLAGEARYKRAGWITISASLIYFVVVKAVFMSSIGVFNQGAGSYGFSFYYEEMIPNKLGELDFLITLLTNPAFIVAHVAKEAKIQYLLVVFGPLLFLPVWAGRARVMLIYGFVFILLASRTAVFSAHFQYSAVLLPVAIALAPIGLRRLQEARPRDTGLTAAVMGCVLVASLLVSWKHGALVENSSFRGGFRPVTRSLNETMREQYDSFVELTGRIDPEASLSVTDRPGPHVSNRAEVYELRQGIDTDFLLIDSSDLRGSNKASLKKREDAGKIELLERRGSWKLYRAAPSPERE
ncbi:MAG: DUF2079 domain-containing protein [Polyangiales bacterium]